MSNDKKQAIEAVNELVAAVNESADSKLLRLSVDTGFLYLPDGTMRISGPSNERIITISVMVEGK